MDRSKEGACWYDEDMYKRLTGGDTCFTLRQLRVTSSYDSGKVNNTIDSVYNDIKPYPYSIGLDRRKYTGGTYCNQVPWLVWDRVGVNIANYYETTELACRSRQESRSIQVFWWTVTVTYTVYEYYWKTVGHDNEFPFIFGDSVLDDDNICEVTRCDPELHNK